jgi:hypothetical protein
VVAVLLRLRQLQLLQHEDTAVSSNTLLLKNTARGDGVVAAPDTTAADHSEGAAPDEREAEVAAGESAILLTGAMPYPPQGGSQQEGMRQTKASHRGPSENGNRTPLLLEEQRHYDTLRIRPQQHQLQQLLPQTPKRLNLREAEGEARMRLRMLTVALAAVVVRALPVAPSEVERPPAEAVEPRVRTRPQLAER